MDDFTHSTDNRIHPTAIIGLGVELGIGNVIGPYAVVAGRTKIGNGNWIAPHACIGTPAESRAHPHAATWDDELGDGCVHIRDGNVIREFVTINAGTEQATTVGSGCYIMARAHLGHDVTIEDGVTLSTASQLGGWTKVWNWANIGLGAQVHQRGEVGPGAMVGMGAVVLRTVDPFLTVVGVPVKPVGINRVGLRRLGVDEAVVDEFEQDMTRLPAGLPASVLDVLERWKARMS